MSLYKTITTGAEVTWDWSLAVARSFIFRLGSRTTTKRQGCEFQAEGAFSANERISSNVPCGTGSCLNLRIERRVRTACLASRSRLAATSIEANDTRFARTRGGVLYIS